MALLAVTLWWGAPSFYSLLAAAQLALFLTLGAGLAFLIIRLLSKLSSKMLWACLLLGMVVIAPFASLGWFFFVLAGLFVLCIVMLGYGMGQRENGSRWKMWCTTIVGSLGLVAMFGLAVVDGWQVDEGIVWQPMVDSPLEVEPLTAFTPLEFTAFTYGPGTDTRRPLFGANVRFATTSVDASKLLDGWSGAGGWARSSFWRTPADQLPLRARVWMPEGEGPFPMVLIVHGNHAMEDYSDDGYSYLGETFAQRGLIALSVDQNMLNSGLSDMLASIDGGLEKENDARGWLLLEHLRLWRQWSRDESHELFAKADLDRVVLIGHSRGGEAVSEAAVFNSLPAYPDDATLKFDYNFGLRGVIAIAPVDHQYDPRGVPTNMQDVNYLVIHGSHDADVTAYAGSATYNRLRFRSCRDCFKAGFYLIGANHGQFNAGWGKFDAPAPYSWFLNAEPLMDAEAQRRVATTLFGAFVEVVVFEDRLYERWLADPHRGTDMLDTDVRFLSQYQSARDQILVDYEEDADVSTASLPDMLVSAQNLTLWQEQIVPLKWRDTNSVAALLGWQAPSSADVPRPAYVLKFAESRVAQPHFALTFDLAMSGKTPGDLEDYETPEAIDFSIAVVDEQAREGVVALSTRRVLLPQVEPVLYKHKALNTDDPSEVIMQRYRFTLAEFMAENPDLDITSISEVRFVFDRTPQGSIWIDNIALHPGSF